MPRWCNHCNAEIDYLYYRADVVEYGRCDIDGSDWNCNDSDTQEATYTCPECEREVDPDELYDEDPNEDEEEEEENDEERVVTQRDVEDRAIVQKVFDEKIFSQRRTSGNVNIVICSNCKHSWSIFTRNDAVCPKCDTENYTNEVITI